METVRWENPRLVSLLTDLYNHSYCQEQNLGEWQAALKNVTRETMMSFFLRISEWSIGKIKSWGTTQVYIRQFQQLYTTVAGRYMDRNDAKELYKVSTNCGSQQFHNDADMGWASSTTRSWSPASDTGHRTSTGSQSSEPITYWPSWHSTLRMILVSSRQNGSALSWLVATSSSATLVRGLPRSCMPKGKNPKTDARTRFSSSKASSPVILSVAKTQRTWIMMTNHHKIKTPFSSTDCWYRKQLDGGVRKPCAMRTYLWWLFAIQWRDEPYRQWPSSSSTTKELTTSQGREYA